METTPRSEGAFQKYEEARGRAQEARRQAAQLREMYGIATCGLAMKYQHRHAHDGENYVNYGTFTVPTHFALRVADSYLVWAEEYETEAARIEESLAAMLRGEHV
ncbi:hypothetical protein [Microbacterium sp. BH-3-3-3]|uniref:hypothetical protein n=1 Tax=Microbacterium sp. BH-3-3-3 TaxID=1906742 RepID=UPI0011AAAD41|nr:hypothetical protein [Microbacterium sp. BH-3-3-3]